jgi:DNA-directed RNA polymerase subunit L
MSYKPVVPKILNVSIIDITPTLPVAIAKTLPESMVESKIFTLTEVVKQHDQVGKQVQRLKTVLKPVACSFEIHGVNVAIANGIRRAILSEVKSCALNFAYDDFETNDPFMRLADFIQNRIQSIPIHQSVDRKLIFKLNVLNGTHSLMTITTADLEVISGNKADARNLFDQTIPIATLNPNKYMKIDKIFIETGYAYTFAGFGQASGASCITLDQVPYNMYDRTGTSSCVSDPRSHKIMFDTNGTVDPKKYIAAACDEIMNRLDQIRKLLYTLQQIGDVHVLVVNGENDTTGNIIVKTICDIYPEIPACTYKVDHVNKSLTLRVRTQDPSAADVINTSIKHSLDTLTHIRNAFK